MLKLIHSASRSFQQNENHREGYVPLNGLSPATLLCHYQEISPNLYTFKFYDTHHELACEITSELKNHFTFSEKPGGEGYLVAVLKGEFPNIDVQRLQRKVPWDDYLHVILVMRFHLKILEQFLLFCKERNVANLALIFGEINLDYMEVFRRFFIAEAQVQTSRGEQREITISANGETYGELLKFINQLGHDFRQNLWRHQKTNPAYRHYLKYLSLLEF